MANIKIAQLTNKTSLADTDLIIVESATQTQKMTVGKFKEIVGIQEGGIVESGSNANGSYIKFADGTMICTHAITQSVAIDAAFAGGYRSSGYPWTYPLPFVGIPKVIPTEISLTCFGAIPVFPGNASANYAYISVGSQGAASRTIGLVAIGRHE